MDMSLFFFASSPAEPAGQAGDCYRLLLESAAFADRNGFAAVWTPERHFHAFGGQYPNPSVVGAALAVTTRRIAIRAGSVVAPLHHAVRIAEEWSVVDNLSHGRAGVSFASGWHPDDFTLRPDAYRDRKKLMAEAVETVRALWRGEAVALPGPDGDAREVRVFPRPVQSELPLWITAAGSPDTFRLAGRLGAGLLTHMLSQDHAALARGIAAYREELTACHGSGARGHVSVMVHTLLGPSRESVRSLVRTPLREYLRSSLDLILRSSGVPAAAGGAPLKLSAQDEEFLLDRACDRYFDTVGLFGTVADGVAAARALEEAGADEVACLIDFGVPEDDILAALPALAEVRGRLAAASEPVPR
ncbi:MULTISPECIES: MupA/Atu3671 family FMN-dependent luciferase-like monooxygenase [unclassified Streptomyces]|uniref:MupA/Atu3671 family FMN-dependent luciferase-like monooxygenase n=1 Tax=unclassified Streptomyces TaxID=2593676 RepID=UPI002E2B1784|nr:MupA/Atu3671 family FMN-dependent luciferase-like monooxygenase [Streptomyces sp. NBC_00223]